MQTFIFPFLFLFFLVDNSTDDKKNNEEPTSNDVAEHLNSPNGHMIHFRVSIIKEIVVNLF